eukprot:TRINITY_DN3_c0_g1_i1.p2 TRINITY_DN3_c0_g1~~TRINITY_DN3_c0_g1_i1.p2  ORF type:complete len:496 (+),score=186.55 TRINITY_DN3_c0_g1_i1:84-1490(+)
MSASLSAITMPKRPALLKAGSSFLTDVLSRQPRYNQQVLANGMKVATEQRNSGGLVSVGLFSRSGSRFETAQTNGTAHLMQQAMMTDALRAYGAKTTSGRETQSITVTCHKDQVKDVISSLSATVSPTFDGAAIEKARPVCLESMKDWEDDLQGIVLHNLHKSCYDVTDATPGQGLGLPPLGSGANVKGGLLPSDVAAFHKQYFANASQLGLVVSGDVDGDAVNEAAEAAFGSCPTGPEPATGKRYVGGAIRISQGVPKAPYANHVALGWEIPGGSCADSLPLQLLMETYGNYDRFQHDLVSNAAIRGTYERQQDQLGLGNLHEMRTFMNQYSDTGVMGFYYTHSIGSTREEAIFFLSRLQFEWVMYCQRLEDYTVEKGKNLLTSKFLFERDGVQKSVATAGKQLMTVGRVLPLEEVIARTNDLTTQQVSDTINHYYYDREPVMSAWGIYYCLPDWYAARRGVQKWRF